MPDPVIIVGAGLAGLCCARSLAHAGIPFLILEASDAVGGRVRTDNVEGFLLDRGFQVLLTAYPEASSVLDYASLKLGTFYPGALIRFDGKFHRVADPWKKPVDAAAAFLSPVSTPADKIRLGLLRQRITAGSVDDLWNHPESSTIGRLRESGFSEASIDRFFRPFFGGVFFDRTLETSSRMFEFTFRMFNTGSTALPAGGMQQIPEQIAAKLPAGSIHLNTRVIGVDSTGVQLSDGRRVPGRAVVVATESHAAAALCRQLAPDLNTHWVSTTTLYFAAAKPPVDEPILVLDGDGTGPINHVAVHSLVCPTLAPAGQHLISLSAVGQHPDAAALRTAAIEQMRRWFGADVDAWRHLRTYTIPHALPLQLPPALQDPYRPSRLDTGLYVAGDHRENASLNGAMLSGRRAAEALIADLVDDHR